MRCSCSAAHREFPRACGFSDQGVSPYRARDILKPLLSEILELNRERASDLIILGGRYEDTACPRDALKPRRYVHHVPKYIMRFNNDVADIDAHAETDALVFRVTDCEFVDAI